MRPSGASLIVFNTYRLKGSAAAFREAIGLLVARVRDEGHPGVLSYRFYVNPDENLVRAVVDYADAGAWIGHHEIAMGWSEMAGLHSVATLCEISFLGAMTPEIGAWLAGSGLTAQVNHGNDFAAGFRR